MVLGAVALAPRPGLGEEYYRFASGSRGSKKPGDPIRPFFAKSSKLRSPGARVEHYLEAARQRYAPDKPSRKGSVFAGIDTHTWEKTFGRVRANTKPGEAPVLMRVAPFRVHVPRSMTLATTSCSTRC
jgi:hypothetical protein